MAETHNLPAGRFSSWLDQIGVDVPCGTCTACCASSQFVHRQSAAHAAASNLRANDRLLPGELRLATPSVDAVRAALTPG